MRKATHKQTVGKLQKLVPQSHTSPQTLAPQGIEPWDI